MKVAIWTTLPNHYQASFFSALRDAGVDLAVRYLHRVRDDRRKMGWNPFEDLPAGETYVGGRDVLQSLEDWPERIHVFSGYRDPVLRGLLDSLCMRGAKWVHWSEPSHPGLKWGLSLPLKRSYARRINEHALGAFGIGERAIADFQRWGVRPDKLCFLPYSNVSYGLDGTHDRECDAFTKGRFTFLFSGALCQRKGIDVLLKAFAPVARRGSASLILVGNDRSGGRYLRLAKSLRIERDAFFRGPVSPNNLGSVYRSADVFCLPSRYDGWGVALGEAASAGLALVSTEQTGAAHHLIVPGENGFRIHAGNLPELTSVLQCYAENRELAAAHGRVSLEMFESFSPRANALRFVRAVTCWQKGRLTAAA